MHSPVGGVSIHVVDVSRGVVATGMQVRVFACDGERKCVAQGSVNAKGVIGDPALMSDLMQPGYYEAVFDVADYYRAAGVPLPERPFLDVVTYRFAVGDARAHYHLPMKVTPGGYSCFRGGA